RELSEDARQVRLDRRLAQVETRTELRIGETRRQQRKDLALAFGQRFQRRRRTLVSAGQAGSEALEQTPRDRRRQERLSRRDDTHALDELLRRHVLEEKAARARAQRFIDVLVEIERRQDKDARLDPAREDSLRRLDAVHARHPDVHQHDVRQYALREVDRLGSVAGFTDDVDVRVSVEDHAEAVADERLVVAEQDADRHSGTDATGSRATTRKPPESIRSAWTVPPKAAARSRIPIRPRPLAPLLAACAFPSSTTST